MARGILNDIKTMRVRMKRHKEAIHNYNGTTLPNVLIISCVITIIPAIVSFFRPNLFIVFPGYMIVFASATLLLLIFKNKKFKKYSLIGAYAIITLFFLLILYQSIYCYPTVPAGTALIYFALINLLFIDRPIRIDLVLIGFFIIHGVLAFIYKGVELGLVDLLNTFISLVLGLLIGWTFLLSRLEAFDAEIQLILEKETDVLTGLKNRRKLFEEINKFGKVDVPLPTGMLMLDVDNFKRYNDKYGHNVGDQCLGVFGEFLRQVESHYKVSIYRYGGEEFFALVWEYDHPKIDDLAEMIRSKTHLLSMPENSITISIGVAYCDDPEAPTYETYVNRADEALYVAKSRGRNRVVVWNPNLES